MICMDNLLIYHLTPKDKDREGSAVQKQLMFFMASVRVKGGGVVILHHQADRQDKSVRDIIRILERMKKRGEIALYVSGEQFRADDAATGYLLDRLPALAEEPCFGVGDAGVTLVYVY